MHRPPCIGDRPGASLERALTGDCYHSGRCIRDAYDRPGGSPVASTRRRRGSHRRFSASATCHNPRIARVLKAHVAPPLVREQRTRWPHRPSWRQPALCSWVHPSVLRMACRGARAERALCLSTAIQLGDRVEKLCAPLVLANARDVCLPFCAWRIGFLPARQRSLPPRSGGLC